LSSHTKGEGDCTPTASLLFSPAMADMHVPTWCTSCSIHLMACDRVRLFLMTRHRRHKYMYLGGWHAAGCRGAECRPIAWPEERERYLTLSNGLASSPSRRRTKLPMQDTKVRPGLILPCSIGLFQTPHELLARDTQQCSNVGMTPALSYRSFPAFVVHVVLHTE